MRAVLLLLSVGWLACSAPTTRPGPRPLPARPTVSPEVAREQRAVRQRVERLTQAVATLRGLAVKRPIAVRWVGPEAVREHGQRALEKEIGRPYIEAYATALGRLGLLPEGYPYLDAVLGVLAEQVAGFYDPDRKVLYMIRGLPADEMILAHEITHALQDQHFNLKRLQGSMKGNDDRDMAITALIEGDATLVMMEHMKASLSFWSVLDLLGSALKVLSMKSPKLDAAPLYLRESLVQPYLLGFALASLLFEGGGFSRLDAAFSTPPSTSEQAMHPDRYLSGEGPRPMQVPDLLPHLGPGFTLLHENTLGEFGAQILLRERGAALASAQAAAEGWGNDRLLCYRHEDGRLALIWRSVWDTPADQAEFASALAAGLDRSFGPASGAVDSASGRTYEKAGRTAILLSTSSGVTLLDADLPPDQAKAINLRIQGASDQNSR